MEQMVIVVIMLAMIYLGLKTNSPVYRIIGGLFAFGLALTIVTDPIFFILLIGLALYQIASVFVSK